MNEEIPFNNRLLTSSETMSKSVALNLEKLITHAFTLIYHPAFLPVWC